MDNIENILTCLIDNLDEGIHIVDNEGKTIYYNKAMGRMEGIKTDDVIGKKVLEYLPGVEEKFSTLMNALSKKQIILDVIQHYSSHFGKEVTTINTTIPVCINGEAIAAVEIAKNMTLLKELNEKICKLQDLDEISAKHYSFSNIIGTSDNLKRAIVKASKASLSNSSVLLYGETGSGKEVFAQSIHYNGLRKNKPFIPINCAAIPSALLESMLFGTVKGSFTGAENKKGLFEEANGGTVLLDELNSMQPFLQSKLLRVLQDGYIRPLGSNKVIDVDVRIIANLNEEPEKLIAEGRLRKDLFYRLSVIRIDVPPLREMKEDIPLLCDYFIEYYNKILGKNINSIDKEIIEGFYQYEWPGNIRELKNVIEAAMNMVEDNNHLSKEYFETKMKKTLKYCLVKNNTFNSKDQSLEDYLFCIEKEIIESTLRNNNNNISKSSLDLKLSRQSLQYKIKKYNLL